MCVRRGGAALRAHGDGSRRLCDRTGVDRVASPCANTESHTATAVARDGDDLIAGEAHELFDVISAKLDAIVVELKAK